MAERPVYIASSAVQSVPTVNFNGTSAVGQALFNLSGVLQRSAGQFEKIHFNEAMQDARSSAIADVEEQRTFEPVRKRGAFWREYNKTGLVAYRQEIELSTRQNAARIAAEHRNDPAAMEQALVDFAEGVEKELPQELKRSFARDFEIWTRPNITAAIERERELADRSAKHSLSALTAQREADARSAGAAIGGADTSTPNGMASMTAAGQALSSIYQDTIDNLQQMIEGGHITIGEAESALQVQRSAITENVILGAFDATEDKAQFFLDFVDGNLIVPIPQVVTGPDGEAIGDDALSFTAGNPMEVMDAKAFDAVRSHMQVRVNALEAARSSARTLADASAEASADALLGEYARTRDPALLDRIEAHPGVSFGDKIRAQKLLRDEGAGETNWDAVSDMEREINLQPHTVSRDEIIRGPYRLSEQRALLDALENRLALDHFATSEPYKQAETRIDRVVGQVSSDIVQVIGGTSAEASSSRLRAAALLKQRLYDTTAEFRDIGYEIGRNPSGKPVEMIPGTDTPRFDPEIWMRNQVEALRTEASKRAGPIREMSNKIRAMRIEQTKLRVAGDHKAANDLGAEVIELQADLSKARRSLDLSDMILTGGMQ